MPNSAWADIPVQILMLGDAAGLQEGEVLGELLPAVEGRARPLSGKADTALRRADW